MRAEKPDYVTSAADLLGISGSLATITKDCADLLEKHYPGWLWTINPDENAGMIYIYSLRLSGEFGYKIRIGDIQNDPRRRLAVDAGGEILERYGLKRGAYKHEYLVGKIQDLRGNYIPDMTDASQRDQKRQRDRTITKAMDEGKITFRATDKVLADGSVHRELYMKIGGGDVDNAG
jgi:hypothetical protein